MITESEWQAIFSACPGAWYGNQPRDGMVGHITVDPERVADACEYLRGRRKLVHVAGTRQSPRDGIQIRLRDAAHVRAQARDARRARVGAMRSLGMVQNRDGSWE